MTPFKDLFSAGAAQYAAYRPRYPEQLFDWLAAAAPSTGAAWDCATGNGQCVAGLARHFTAVVATDGSAAQLSAAAPTPGVEYRVALAESSGLPDHRFDLVTVAQALHWFDLSRFWPEVRRVARPGGIIAAWCYNDTRWITPAIDPVLQRFEQGVVGPYWSPDRALVDAGYREVSFPFEELPVPSFEMRATWTLDQLVGYLSTWSATQKFIAANGVDPIPALRVELVPVWGDADLVRPVVWPLFFRVGRVG